MHEKLENSETWTVCPAGTLVKIASEKRAVQSRRQLTRWGVGVVSSGLLVILCLYGFQAPRNPANLPYAGLVCDEVEAFEEPFFADQLNRSMRARVIRHLTDCEKCKAKYQQRAAELNIEFELVAAAHHTRQQDYYDHVLALMSSSER